MRVLVTGGAGFIGSHLVDRFVTLGHEVVALDDLSSGTRNNVNANAKLVVADIRGPEAAAAVTAFCPQIVVHHAAQMDVRKSVADPAFDADVNIVGLLSLMEAARTAGGLEHVIFASSGGAMYGEQSVGELDGATQPALEDTPPQPASPYGLSKSVSEQYLAWYHRTYGVTSTSLRYGNVYGPRQNPHGEAGVVAIFCARILEGKPITITGDGKQTRDYVFVDDVVDANAKALSSRVQGGFNVGTGKETDVVKLANVLVGASNKNVEIVHGPSRAGEQRRSLLNPSLYQRVTGWRATVPVEDGLVRTYRWFAERSV